MRLGQELVVQHALREGQPVTLQLPQSHLIRYRRRDDGSLNSQNTMALESEAQNYLWTPEAHNCLLIPEAQDIIYYLLLADSPVNR